MFASDQIASLSEEQLESALAEQAAHVDAGLCRLLELTAECERRLPRADEGTTFAGWLAWRCSLLPRQAREHTRIAQHLAELPLIHAAFAHGELSYAKVSTLVRLADTHNEAKLLELAQVLTASQLQRAVAAYERVSREDAAEQQAQEFLDCFWTEDGSLSLRARLAAEEGALAAARARGRPGRAARAPADAETAAGVPPRPQSRSERRSARRDRRSGARRSTTRTAPAASATRSSSTSMRGRWPRTPTAAASSPTAARSPPKRRGASHATHPLELREHDGETLSLGRKRRTLSPALRRALDSRDRGCRFPGCERTRFVDAHHLQHWSQGGETNLDNLISLCRRHHRFVHERGYSVKLGDDGELQFANQHGIAHPERTTLPTLTSRRASPTSTSAVRPRDRRPHLQQRHRRPDGARLHPRRALLDRRLELEPDLVDEAPAPVLTGLRRAGDRMADLGRVCARMSVRRRVATADLAAALAHAQVKPAAADLQALLAAGDRRRKLRDRDLVEMAAGRVAHLA